MKLGAFRGHLKQKKRNHEQNIKWNHFLSPEEAYEENCSCKYLVICVGRLNLNMRIATRDTET